MGMTSNAKKDWLKSLGYWYMVVMVCFGESSEMNWGRVVVEFYIITLGFCPHGSSDNLPPPQWVRITQLEGGRLLQLEWKRHPPKKFLNVNLLIVDVYTPAYICLYPPNFKFLEIILHGSSSTNGHGLPPNLSYFLWHMGVGRPLQ